MTPEERLKQTEILLETAARYINRHEEQLLRIDEQFIQTNLQMRQLADLITELAAISRQHQARIEQNEERSRQNQAEIRRIWEYLLSQSGNGQIDLLQKFFMI